jgi:hypothetical protein
MDELTPEQINSIKEKLQSMLLYDEKLKIAEQNNIEKLDELVGIVNAIFKKNNINETINKTHIKFYADYIGNISNIEDKKLSKIIFDAIYPKPLLERYSHYTTFKGACSILKNKEFWIFNLIKNFDAEEFRLFYEQHNVTGYRDLSETFGIKTDYRSLMAEQFSLCLTSENNKSPSLWNYFGYKGTGIKLTFEIDSHIPDFREVYYSDKNNPTQIKLFSELSQEIFDKYNYIFNFSNISKIGAFYIHGKFNNEKEYRFLVKRTSDDYDAWNFEPIIFKDDVTYIVLPFESRLASFKLKKVSKGPNVSSSDFEVIKQIINDNYNETIEIEE